MKKVSLFAGILAFAFVCNAYAEIKPEHDPIKPRVPPDKIAAVKAMKPPFQATPAIIAEGKALFDGKATCFMCHGNDGKGKGVGAESLTKVGPRNFTNPQFHKVKSCGEMFWVAANGTKGDFSKKDAPTHPQGTGMVNYLIGHNSELGLPGTPTVTKDELWKIVLYERSLGGGKCE